MKELSGRFVWLQVLATYITLVSLEAVTGRSHGLKYNHHHYHLHNSYHNRNHPNPTSLDNSGENKERNAVSHKHHHDKSAPWRPSSSSMDDYEDDDDDGDDGRHAYLMTKNKGNKKSSASSEDQTLTSVFEKHIQGATNIHHDVYAYQLPSDLWFIVRYSKNEDGQMEKYM